METFNLPERPKALIFDIDATLYTCPEYAHEQIDAQVRHYAALNGITADEARRMVADFRRKWAAEHGGQKISLGNLLKSFGIPIETSIEWRKKLFDPADYLGRDERLMEAVGRLAERFALVCVTNNPVLPARRTLEVLGVDLLIPRIAGLDTCLESKPSRRLLETAMAWAAEDFGSEVRAEDCISVGDRFDIDLKLPIEMGMGGILVRGAEDVYDLPNLLGA